MTTLTFTKGHGTANDFVLVFDPDNRVDLSPQTVAFLCDRRRGIGGDGVIRAVKAGAVDAPHGVGPDHWFMDYWNADGTVSEMCGNGARVFGALLEREAGQDLSQPLTFGTRGGPRTVRSTAPGIYAIDMGPWAVTGSSDTSDAVVTIAGLETPRPGLSVNISNPHVVVALVSDAELDSADLSGPPLVDPPPPHGANVELVVPYGERTVAGQRRGHVRMRVHERGSGETMSCGTGACAVAVAVRTWAGEQAPTVWDIDVPGGSVTVEIEPHRTVLTGPAVVVAEGTVTLPE